MTLQYYEVLIIVSNGYPSAKGRLPTRYSPVRRSPFLQSTEVSIRNFPLDLHVLGTPPAFILSQDQTLNQNGISKAKALAIILKVLPLSDERFAFVLFQNHGFKKLFVCDPLACDCSLAVVYSTKFLHYEVFKVHAAKAAVRRGAEHLTS